MKQVFPIIQQNRKIAENVYELTLAGEFPETIKAGQFVNLTVPGCYLRRPISVCDFDGDRLTLVYKVVGKGTEIMSRLPIGEKVDVLTGLGNGYDLEKSGEKPLLVGGGAGVPPLYLLCKKLIKRGVKPTVILGFNKKEEVFYEEEFANAGAEVLLATADGSAGQKGFVTDLIKDLSYTYCYACGPLPMLKALNGVLTSGAEFSMEERMGCGFGVCMGCSIMTKNGAKRVCKEGPVFDRGELLWEAQK